MSVISLTDYLADQDCPELIDAYDFNPFAPADELEEYYSEEDGYSYTD